MPETERPQSEAVHTMFSLSYANYLVLHRTLLQSMPDAWQEKFVALLNEYDQAFAHVERPDAFDVTPGTDCYVNELTPNQLALVGIAAEDHEDDNGEYAHTTYTEIRTGRDVLDIEHVVLPGEDPVPHYNRGRAYIEPRTRAEAADVQP